MTWGDSIKSRFSRGYRIKITNFLPASTPENYLDITLLSITKKFFLVLTNIIAIVKALISRDWAGGRRDAGTRGR
ncbi:MAG TPA: hypothetical protein VK203_13610, partial [Nostocaceae cyanobacterium]|nr:hypothetical protein [Nostocaceae cyanobacterium]